MNAATYTLPTFAGLVEHGWLKTTFVRDGISEDEMQDIDVQVRSGDYFVTLATTLDQLSRNVKEHHIRAELEDTVSDLIYLQDHYTITKNSKSN